MGIGFGRLAAGALAAVLSFGAAQAAVVTVGPGGFDNGYATRITFEDDLATARRGTANGRNNPFHALGSDANNFFEIGLGSSVTLTFGKAFTGATIRERTDGNPAAWKETAMIEAIRRDGSTKLLGTFSNAQAQGSGLLLTMLDGPFEALRITDTSKPIPGNALTGGFDIASVQVAPIPVPAGILLLGTGLAAFGLLRRRRPA